MHKDLLKDTRCLATDVWRLLCDHTTAESSWELAIDLQDQEYNSAYLGSENVRAKSSE